MSDQVGEILDHAPDAVYCKILEVDSPGELLGHSPARFHSEGRLDFSEFVLSMDDVHRLERNMQTARGRPIWLAFTVKVVEDSQGRLVFEGAVEDVTQKRWIQQERDAALARFRNAIEAAPMPVMLHRASGRVEEVNRIWCELTGYSRDELRSVEDWLRKAYPHHHQTVRDAVRKLASRDGPTDEGDFEIRCKDGSVRIWAFQSSPLEQADAEDRLIMSTALDVTDERRVARRMHQVEALWENAVEGITITDSERRIERVNPAFTRITGYTESEVLGKNPKILSSGRQSEAFYRRMWDSINRRGHWQGEIWNRRKNGEIYPEWLSISAIRDQEGRIVNYAGIFTNLTELKRSQERLETYRRFDPLTALFNRDELQRRLQSRLDSLDDFNRIVVVMVIGLDRFHRINDSYTYETGDRLLKHIARRLKRVAGESANVARIGGDQFAITLHRLEREHDLFRILREIQEHISRPIDLGDVPPTSISFSTGIARYPTDGKTANQLLRNAESAMFTAKREQRGSYAFFDSRQTELAQQKLSIENDLKAAIKNDRITVHYQPIVDVATNRILGAEALARWMHPGRGAVSPAEFIAVAEECGLIALLSEKLLGRVTRDAPKLRECFGDGFLLAFNISTTQLKIPDFASNLLARLDESGLPRDCFELELTESTMMEQGEVSVRVLHEFRAGGIRLSIDDFGTGFSSLSYLQELNAHTLKIDRKFINDLGRQAPGERIVESIIAMAKALEMRVTAEGVETRQQLDRLRELGCDCYQGYLFSRPLPLKEFLGLEAN